MKFNDSINGAALLALAVAVIAYGHGLPKMPGQFVGPGLFPSLIAVALAIAAIVLILRGWRSGDQWLRLDPWTRQPALLVRFAAIPLVVLVYVGFSETIGFVPLAFVGLAALFLLGRVRWAVALPIAAVATAAVYYAFAVILRVPLPHIALWGMDTWGLPF